MNGITSVDDQLVKHREWLIESERKSQEDYDKTIISFSSAAIGVSIVFVKDIVGTHPIVNRELFGLALLVWGISVAFVLASFYFSRLALHKAIEQVDNDQAYETIPGGVFTRILDILNVLSGVLFLLGLVFIGMFAMNNLPT